MLSLFGAIPTEISPAFLGGTEKLTSRWCQFLETARPNLAPDALKDTRVWRFICAPQIFEEFAVAGVWNMSRTNGGQVLPLALLTCTDVPAPDDRWFEACETLLRNVRQQGYDLSKIKQEISELPQYRPVDSPQHGAQFWIEDWEVHHLPFPSIHELAKDGFAQMLAARPEVGGA